MSSLIRSALSLALIVSITPWAAGIGAAFTLGEDDLYEVVKDDVSAESFASLTLQQKRMLANAIINPSQVPSERSVCFSGPLPNDVMAVFNQSIFGTQKFEENVGRWSTTATDGGGLAQGDATVITYSFIPDGTSIPGDPGIGNPTANSDLFAFFDGIYGSTAAWQAEFAQMFADWTAITGVSYVEVSDDGAAFPSSGGSLGARGDVRIGGHFIDGESGSNILAYNFFPNNGDMVIDTANPAFYGNLGGDSINLRNTVSHEHGHGLGMPHTCPTDNTKLMEPFINTNFDGPQIDDRLSGQKHYGDGNNGNDSTGTATDLGALNNETASETLVSLYDVSEDDFYEFTIASTHDISLLLTPTGADYLSGLQNPGDGSCTAGSSFNTLTFMNLDIELIDTDGSTVLDTGDANAAGLAETATLAAAPPGTYFARVYSDDGSGNVQAYDLDVTVTAAAGPQVSNPSGGGLLELSDGSTQLSFTVTGNVDPTTYQWSKDMTPLANGGNISGADTPTLTINPIGLSDSGDYILTVTDSSVKLVTVSSPITLTVVTALPVFGALGMGLVAGTLGAAGAWAVRRRRRQH